MNEPPQRNGYKRTSAGPASCRHPRGERRAVGNRLASGAASGGVATALPARERRVADKYCAAVELVPVRAVPQWQGHPPVIRGRGQVADVGHVRAGDQCEVDQCEVEQLGVPAGLSDESQRSART